MTRPFEHREIGPSEHPVDHFRTLVGQLDDADYPRGVVRVPGWDEGTVFFSAGAGLVRRRGEPLPPFPYGGVMLVGHNLDSLAAYREHRTQGRLDPGDPDNPPMQTWRKTYELLNRAGVNRSRVFFTNVYVGLKDNGASPSGAFPGRTDASFCEWCEAFLDEQIRVMRPHVVAALGSWAQRETGWRAGEISQQTRVGATFTSVGLRHPSHPGYYQRLAEGQRIDREAELLRQAMDHA